jgi:hypothetical protein
MQENVFNIGLLLFAIPKEIERCAETIYYAPQTALSGFLYGLIHNEGTAKQTALDTSLRRKYERYRLARSITRVKQSTDLVNDELEISFSDEDLRKMILICDFTRLKDRLSLELSVEKNSSRIKILKERQKAIEELENLSLGMRKIIAEMKNGKEKNLLGQSMFLQQDVANDNEEIKKLAELLCDKDSIDCDFEVFEFILSLFNKQNNDKFTLPSPKELNKKIFNYFRKLGDLLRGLIIIQSIKDNKFLNLVIGIVGLLVLIPTYILLGATKTLKSIFVGTFDVIKIMLLGIYMGFKRDVKKEEIARLIIDLKTPLNEFKSIYKCVFASINQDITQWDHASGKNSLMRVIEKLIYELLTKISVNYKGLINDESIEAQDIKDARELVAKIDDPTQHQDKEENLKKLFDLFENKLAIPFFEISNSLQHIHTLGETIRIFVQRSTFTAAHNFTDYVIGRRDNENELGIA